MELNLLTTIKGSLMERFLPAGWDLAKIDACCGHDPREITERMPWWHPAFEPVCCVSLADFEVRMGHEIAMEIRRARDAAQELALILPVGPMGMYRWCVYFLTEWGVGCSHVHGFNMDEWSDAQGNTLPRETQGTFEWAMTETLYGPLAEMTVPPNQRHFATRSSLPEYAGLIGEVKARGGRLVTVYGIGRTCHIALWEPYFAAEFPSVEEWQAQTHRLAASVHPLTAEQSAITSYKSRMTAIPAFGNTIGPGIFLRSDRCIGGCDGVLGRGMMWQGMSLWITLRYGPDTWLPATWMPALPGRLFFVGDLAGPLVTELN